MPYSMTRNIKRKRAISANQKHHDIASHMEPQTNIIRISIRSLYDLQKLRIQAGNRIFQAFRQKLGITSSEAEEELSPEAEEVLRQLRAEFKRITDGVKRITKTIELESNLITNAAELYLIQAYERQLDAEESHTKVVLDELQRHAIYRDWLSVVRGVGPLMAGVILSEIDIHKCNSISALWKYAGVDVITYTDEETGEYHEEGRCRKARHLVPKTYTNKKGEVKETVGITFNPFLKTKMVGVLGAVFIKLGGPYRDIYDNYKHRLQNHPKHKVKTKGHIHAMATRYMIKEFLADLWTKWRGMEGLEVRARYPEDKLGLVHSHDKAA
jgi:hypothetical protein